MRVLVLGGTGAMGVHLVELLSKKGIEVFVTSRNNKDSVGNIHFKQGNAHDDLFLKTLLTEKWDAIVDFMVYTTESFCNRVDQLLDSTSQYFFLSSARVYADLESPIYETSPRLLELSLDEKFLATDDYSLAKARQEDLLRGSGRNNWIILRPYITFSEDRLQLGLLEKEEWLYRALHGRTIVFDRDLCKKITTLTFGGDVSKGIISLIGNLEANGEVFQITNDAYITWEEVLTIYLDVLEEYLGSRPNVVFEDFDRIFVWKRAKYQMIYDRMFNRKFNNSKIAKFVDISSFTDTRDGLRNSLKIFLRNPRFKNINWKAEALKDRRTHERTFLVEIDQPYDKLKYLAIRYFGLFAG